MAITREQALDFFRSDDLLGLGMEADALRRSLHPQAAASYSIDCRLHAEAAADNLDLACRHIADAVALGATSVALHSSARPQVSASLQSAAPQQSAAPLSSAAPLQIAACETLLRTLRQRFPQLPLHGFSASAILRIANSSGIAAPDALARLRDAGLDSIAAPDVAVLDDDLRLRFNPAMCSSKDWLALHRAAHGLGLRTVAGIATGWGETPEHCIRHFEAIHRLQEETGGFLAFLPWVRLDLQTPGEPTREQPTAVEALKVLAIARLYLSSIANIQATWETQGLKVLQMALRLGANDAGAVLPAEPATRAARTTEETLRRIIRDAGLRPLQRDALYTTTLLN